MTAATTLLVQISELFGHGGKVERELEERGEDPKQFREELWGTEDNDDGPLNRICGLLI